MIKGLLRQGRDEFALILGGTGGDVVRKIADTIHKGVYDLGLVYGGSKRVTVSLGVVSAAPDMDLEEKFLLEKADKALYRAKSAGRNRVVYERIGNDK